jgi:DNA polymerase-3 subunit alpha
MPRFTHLHTHSHYSLLDGLAKIEDLVKHAKALGMDSVALTDHGNLYGAIEFYKAAKKEGLKPIMGVEAYIAPGDRRDKNNKDDSKYYHLVLLAENDIGWKNLIKLITRANLEGFYYKPRMDKEILREHHEGLIALSACLAGEVSRNLERANYEGAKKAALEYDQIFGRGNFFLEIGHHPGIPETIPQREGLLKIAAETGIPLVATQDIHYLRKEDAEVHDVLLAIGTGDLVSKSDRLTLKNDDFSMRSPDEMTALFAELPEAVENTAEIADRCNVNIKLGETQLPKFPLPPGVEANAYMRTLVDERIGARYPEITQTVKDRLEYELSVIEKMGFADYFLIVQDFINWAKERGIVVGPGRGSAAGSLVSYVLGITDVDPIHYGLLFERFLNPDRIQLPDIDVDFTDRRRDEVFGYLQEKYGVDRVAHIITFGTMAARASIRDVGRALGMSYGFCDQIAKLIPFNQDLGEALENVEELKKLYAESEDAKRVIDIAKKLEGVARHASVHACGTVISKNPLTDCLPLQHAPQDEQVVLTQFEMHSVEDLGLLKMDLLGLKNLTIIEDTLRLVLESENENIDMRRIPLDDKRVFELLQAGDTTGVFQLESSGMRRYLKELKPTSIEDIVAMVALYRPGPMDLIPEYIAVKHGRKAAQYLHPKLEPILGVTYGVGVYQEQMMRIARDLAGFSLAEADTLRKAIGKKIKELLDKQKEKLVAGMVKNEIPEATALAIWELFPPFARYGFNRSHAVCYAWVGYQTAYLKAHYPVEFMTSLLNSDAGDVERASFLIGEAKKGGIEILPPDVNKSSANFTPEGKNIRFGLAAIKNVGEAIVGAIIAERESGGPFRNLADLLTRVKHKDLNKKSLESLAKCGAVDSFGIGRGTVLGNLEDIVKFGSALKKAASSSQSGLFGSAPPNSLRIKPFPETEVKEKLQWEKELLGLYVSDHPLRAHLPKIQALKTTPIPDAFKEKSELNRLFLAGIVTRVQKIVTKKGQPMAFTKIEDMNGAIELIVFPETLTRTNAIWKEGAVVLVGGKMSWKDNEPRFIVDNGREL